MKHKRRNLMGFFEAQRAKIKMDFKKLPENLPLKLFSDAFFLIDHFLWVQ
jgi:hypothetical protein